jgi:hypothetical protein
MMHLVSEFLVVFTYYGFGVIVVSLVVGHLLDQRALRRDRTRGSGEQAGS